MRYVLQRRIRIINLGVRHLVFEPGTDYFLYTGKQVLHRLESTCYSQTIVSDGKLFRQDIV